MTGITQFRSELKTHLFHQKFFPLILWDGLSVVISFLVALTFRFDGSIPLKSLQVFIVTAPILILLYGFINIVFSLYTHIWRYVSAQQVMSVILSGVTSTILVALFILSYDPVRDLPLSVILLAGIFTTGLFVIVRYQKRLVTGAIGRLQKVVGSADRKRILIVGAGESAQHLVQQLQNHEQRHHYELTGFVDDDPQKWGLHLYNLPILGDRHAIPRLVAECNIHLIIIAVPNISGQALREMLSLCLETDTQVKILPDFLDAINSSQSFPLVRDISPADLLGRQPYDIDKTACHNLIANKVVLVTGASGSIGSELCRQLLNFHPAKLVMIDNNESGLYDLTLSLNKSEQLGEHVAPVVADITNPLKMRQLFDVYRPQIVFHAAAYKHVPLMEQQPDEAVRVNVQGTRIVIDLAERYEVERFVFVSSDKAINPTSIMGATKRLGELLITSRTSCQNFTRYQRPPTRFTAVRFGNVLGSRGSVVPTFTRQIEQGGPVTITHPDMRRYFISISEAISLVIQAATLTRGNDLFMLDMGQEIRITDLAYKMIRLRGLRPKQDIPIQYTGVRPGEKLSEELLAPNEKRLRTGHPKIFRILSNTQIDDYSLLEHQLNVLVELGQSQQFDEMQRLLWQLTRGELKPTDVVAPAEIVRFAYEYSF